MDKRQAVEFLEYLRQDRNLEKTIYGDALKIAIESLKAQLFKEGTTSDLISRTETVEHLRRMLEATVTNTDYDEGFVDGIEFAISTASTMPTIQPQSTAGQLNDSAQSTNLIDRQAAIDAIENSSKPYVWQGADIIRNLPTIQPEPQWIPVSERMPRDGTWNIFTDGKNISVERYKADAIDHFFPNGRWFQLEDVIAWMPLPTPYTK